MDAFETVRITFLDDLVNPACEIEGGWHTEEFAEQPIRYLPAPWRAAFLWITATFLATAWTSGVQADSFAEPRVPLHLAQTTPSDPVSVQGVQEQEPHRTETPAPDFAARQRDIESQLQLLLQQDRASRLEHDLAATRGDVETRTAPVAKAGDEANQLKKAADAATADLQKSLQQERDRATGLEQDLAAARRDIETQTALAAKANEEASQLKKTADAGTADLQKSLQQEHDRASRLEQDLVAARSDVEAQKALAAKAADGARKTADASTADLRKSLQQERDRATRLQQDLAAARRDVETQTALAARAADEASQLKKAADAGTADLRKSLQQERDRASRLEQDFAAARSDVEAQKALAAKAADGARKTADASTADLRKSLQQEHDHATRLEQDLAAARRDVETQTALAAKAGDEASQLKKTADAATADLQKSLQQEHDRASRLEQDFAAARHVVETQAVLATRAGDEAVQLKPDIESGSGDLRQTLQPERDRKARPDGDFAPARSKQNARAPSVAATDEINRQSEADAIAGLVARANVLLGRGDIGSARTVLERAAEAGNAEASFKLAETYDPFILSKWRTYGTPGDAMKALDLYAKAQAGGIMEAKERLDALRPDGDLALARSKENALAPSVAATDEINRQSEADAIGGLVARANVLLGRGDIGSARTVLERAAEAGNAEASFKLAETYDPFILSKWGTYGTRGDAMKALDLYAKAQAGGIMEAKERLDALRPQRRETKQ